VQETVDRLGQYSGEIPLLGRDGVARLNQLSVTPLVSGGLSVGYTCVSFDIGERKRMEELQRAYFEQVGEAIVVVDLSSLRVVDVNDQACRIYGYSREEFLALNTSALRPSGTAVPDSEISDILQRKGVYESDRETARRKDGSSFPTSLNIRLISIGGKLFTVGVIRDLTAQRRAEEFQRVLFEQAGEAIVLVDHSTFRVVDANDRRPSCTATRGTNSCASESRTTSRRTSKHEVMQIARALEERAHYEGRQSTAARTGRCSLLAQPENRHGVDRRWCIGVHRDLTGAAQGGGIPPRPLRAGGRCRRGHRPGNPGSSRRQRQVRRAVRLHAGGIPAPPRRRLRGARDSGRGRCRSAGSSRRRAATRGRQFHRRKDGSVFPLLHQSQDGDDQRPQPGDLRHPRLDRGA
jgi:PAS domain S-box-containing protein